MKVTCKIQVNLMKMVTKTNDTTTQQPTNCLNLFDALQLYQKRVSGTGVFL